MTDGHVPWAGWLAVVVGGGALAALARASRASAPVPAPAGQVLYVVGSPLRRPIGQPFPFVPPVVAPWQDPFCYRPVVALRNK